MTEGKVNTSDNVGHKPEYTDGMMCQLHHTDAPSVCGEGQLQNWHV